MLGDALVRDVTSSDVSHMCMATLLFNETIEPPMEEEAIETLVDWSQALDFDAYMNDWHSVATSLRSDGITVFGTEAPAL